MKMHLTTTEKLRPVADAFFSRLQSPGRGRDIQSAQGRTSAVANVAGGQCDDPWQQSIQALTGYSQVRGWCLWGVVGLTPRLPPYDLRWVNASTPKRRRTAGKGLFSCVQSAQLGRLDFVRHSAARERERDVISQILCQFRRNIWANVLYFST